MIKTLITIFLIFGSTAYAQNTDPFDDMEAALRQLESVLASEDTGVAVLCDDSSPVISSRASEDVQAFCADEPKLSRNPLQVAIEAVSEMRIAVKKIEDKINVHAGEISRIFDSYNKLHTRVHSLEYPTSSASTTRIVTPVAPRQERRAPRTSNGLPKHGGFNNR